MGCGEFIVKYILFFVNLFFALAGLALLGLGVAVHLKVTDVVTIAEHNVTVAPISAMVLGGIVFLISFFGCCGAIKESNCMLTFYAILMIILMVLKVIMATLIFLNLDQILVDVPTYLNDLFNNNNFIPIQETLKCCGVDGPQSYGLKPLPDSCCQSTPCTVLNAYSGCSGVVQDLFYNFGMAIGGVAICIAAIELVAVVFGLCLANHVRNKGRRARY